MTIVFWLIVATLILVALLIVILPILRNKTIDLADDPEQRNLGIARGRLAELKANLAAGGISQSQYDEQVTELELALSDDLDFTQTLTATAAATNSGRWLVYVLMLLVPVLSLGLYSVLGNYPAINYVPEANPTAETNPANPELPSPEAINQMVAKLAEKMQKDPNNAEGWFMLGRSYKMLQRYPEAVDALAKAYGLAGDKPDVMLAYAEALALSKNSDWAGFPKQLVLTALAKEPDNLNGLWLAALSHAQQGDKTAALNFLRKLEAKLPDDSPDKPQIKDIIANTENESGKTDSATDKAAQPSQPTLSIAVQVSLSEEFKTKANAEDTVFIYAQAISGPKMPLAIVRKQVKDLPTSVKLTDADSMMPAMKLSQFKQVRLLARVSKSGNAMPQKGDLIGKAENVEVANSKANTVVIDGFVDE